MARTKINMRTRYPPRQFPPSPVRKPWWERNVDSSDEYDTDDDALQHPDVLVSKVTWEDKGYCNKFYFKSRTDANLCCHAKPLPRARIVGRDGKVADYLIFNVAGKWHHFKRIPSEGEDEQSPVFHSSKSKSNESDKQDK